MSGVSGSIRELRNLGPGSAEWLESSGVTTVAQLQELGAVVVWVMVKKNHPKVSLNLLWALVAGLAEQDWRQLSQQEKNRLKQQVRELL